MKEQITEILKEAGEIAIRYQESKLTRLDKGNGDFATEADLEVQRFLKESLSAVFPEINVSGEEDEEFNLDLTNSFIIDPIDGTFDFAYGGEEWGILISYFLRGRVEMSFVYQPKLNNLLISTADEDSVLNSNVVSPLIFNSSISESIVIQCLGNWLTNDYVDRICSPIVKSARISRSFSSAAMVAIQLAQGKGHLFVGEGGKVWDYAPISLLIENLGGKNCDLLGKELSWSKDRMSIVSGINQILVDGLIHIISN